MSHFNEKPPIYVLPHGIEVLSENHSCRYVMAYIIAHPLFPNSKINNDTSRPRQYLQLARVIMTSILGRPLARDEHVHHKDENVHNNDPSNLEILTSDQHNKHHKIGYKHREEIKLQIGNSLKLAYVEGRHKSPDVKGDKNPFFGKNHTEETKAKISAARRKIV